MRPQPAPNQGVEVDPRVTFAAERTLLAWIRTGLAMMGFGFVVARFGLFMQEVLAVRGLSAAPGFGLSRWVGTALVLLGVAVNFAAGAQHVRRLKQLSYGEPVAAKGWSLATAVAGLLTVLGIFMAAYLLVNPQ